MCSRPLVRPPLGRLGTSVLLASAALLVAPAALAQPAWTFHDGVIPGSQLDAMRGPDDHLHVVSTVYAQIDTSGSVLVQEDQGDERQGSLDFPPAIAVGADGSVHIVTRHGGTYDAGHDIRYRRRNDQGQWDRDYLVGTPVKRNYVVGAAWVAADQVYLLSSQAGSNVWGDLHLWQAGASSATELGSLSGIWRADADARMRGGDGWVSVVSGLPDPGGSAFLLWANAGPSVASDLAANQHEHQSGTGRRGFTDLYVDATGTTHLTYGAEQTVFYNRYSPTGQAELASDRQLFDGLGTWHLSAGLSAVTATDDGEKVLAVALRSDGSQQAADSDILWSYSVDGGQTWSAPADLERNTNAGEGRHRPRLVAIGQQVFLVYVDNGVAGVSLASIDLAIDADDDGFAEDEDCNDQDPDIYPGAPERCNGEDDDCDGDTDEGCPCVDGSEQPCGTDVGQCELGVQQCENEQWGACVGAVEPSDEICDGLDNDCDGDTDEQCTTGTGGSAATPTNPEADDGCGCVVGRRQIPRSALGWALALCASVPLLRRRRHDPRRRAPQRPRRRDVGPRTSESRMQVVLALWPPGHRVRWRS